MTESLKLSELHRTNIEYERQRHLANWLIKSSPHMAKPTPGSTSISSTGTTTSKSQQKLTKSGTISQNPLYFLTKSASNNHNAGVGGAGGGGGGGGGGNGGGGGGGGAVSGTATANAGNLAMSRSAIFNSQTNLPLQILTSQEGHKPKLRRFNSHDTSANMFSVADFENARLARRNEQEIKQRQQNRYKMNSLSSGGDCSTGDSKGSKFSSDSHTELLPADLFLDRFSMPRVVRVTTVAPKFSVETIQSSSSNGSSSGGSTSVLNSINKKDHQQLSIGSKQNGELFLLFRHLKNRRICHGINTKNGATRKKGVMIPQEFQGYFSTVNEKGAATATMYTTLVQLVRERVYKFLSVDNLAAYTESTNTDTFPQRPHYVKVTAQRGQVFRLLAVFEDDKHDSSTTNSNKHNSNSNATAISSSGGSNAFREKEKGRYVQLLTESRQIVYVALTAKGKFYEIEPMTPQIFQKTNSAAGMFSSGGASSDAAAAKPFNADCIHRIGQIVHAQSELPLTIRFVSGPQGTGNIVPEVLTITKVTTENIVVACPIEDVEARSPLHLRKLNVTGEMQFMKCFLGFENELKMFSNPNIQNILKFCQINVDNFMRLVEFEHLSGGSSKSLSAGGAGHGGGTTKSKGDGGLKILKPLNFLRREKSSIAHEKEDSIIFLSKNDLENMDNKEASATLDPTAKLKVFQSTKKKWFRNLKSSSSSAATKSNSFASLDVDIQSKRMSMDRYQDMSKLLQERFGDNDHDGLTASPIDNSKRTHAGRPSSEIGLDARCDLEHGDLRQKSMSLQDMDTRCEYTNKPDLVRVDYHRDSGHVHKDSADDDELADASIISLSNQQSFITEKLFNEFHVKTKQHSKSSSHLHHLLHFAVPQKMNVHETTRKKDDGAGTSSADHTKAYNRIEFADQYPSMTMGNSTSFDDDLPYSSVRDSLVMDDNVASGGGGGEMTELVCPMETHPLNYGINNVDNQLNDSHRHENIYAEICSDAANPTISNDRHNRSSAIRISVKSSAHDAAASVVAARRRSDAHMNGDNIYNTLN